MSVTDFTPGSLAPLKSWVGWLFLYQSKILPTKGDIKKSLDYAHWTACVLLKISVILQFILSLFKVSAALIPSHVEAILIKTRSFSTPFYLYSWIILLALSTVASLSKERAASTYVETYPGNFFSNSQPKLTERWSQTRLT